MKRRMSGLRWMLVVCYAITVAATLAAIHRESPLDEVGLTVGSVLVIVALAVGPFIGPAYLLGERLGIVVGGIVALAGLVWLARWVIDGLLQNLAGVVTRLGVAWQRGQVTMLPYVPHTAWTDDSRNHFHEGAGYHAHDHAGWHCHAPPTYHIDRRSFHVHLDDEQGRQP